MKRAVPPEMSDSESGRSLADVVYDTVKADIIWGRLEPDQPLRSDDLQKAYSIGVSPLREALSRLSSEGLVVRSAQRGFKVSPLTPVQIIDTARTRVLIEGEALSKAMENGDLAWEAGIVAATHSLTGTLYSGEMRPESEAWAEQHRRFHFALIAGCGSELLIRLSSNLFDHAERHRVVGERVRVQNEAAGVVGGRNRIKEHETLAKAVVARNEVKALDFMKRHLLLTAQSVVAALGEDPLQSLRPARRASTANRESGGRATG